MEKVKEYRIKSDKIDDQLIELILTKDKMDLMTGDDNDHQIHSTLQKTNEKYKVLLKKWKELIDSIENYYKTKLTRIFKFYGEGAVRESHKVILEYLQKDEQYEIATGVICFDLTAFTRHLIKSSK